MKKILVFDDVNLETALLARQISDTNPDVWIFLIGDIPKNIQPIIFKLDDNISWLLNFCDIDAATLHQNDADIEVCVPNINTGTLIDRLLGKPNISLTADTPVTIDLNAKTVKLDDVAGYSFVPFGDIRSIFVSTPIDRFYNFKFGRLVYRTPTYIGTKDGYSQVTDIVYEQAIDSPYATKLTWFTDGAATNIDIDFDLTYASDTVFALDTVIKNNITLFKQYLAYNKLHRQIKYIGPTIVPWPANPLYVDMSAIFNNIGKV